MTFTVANIISAFNSKSGGPPRTVSLIAAAGVGHWRAELFTTDYLESTADLLLTPEFPGHVNLLPASAHGMLGGISLAVRKNPPFSRQLLKGAAPNVIHIHGLWSPFLAAFAATAVRNRIPYIVAPHGMLEPWSLAVRRRRKELALQYYQGRIIGKASAIHATSELEAQHIRLVNSSRVPIFVVPNIIEEPPALGAGESEPRYEDRVMLFLSRLHEKKGLDILLQAWSETRPAGWRLLIVGSGEAVYEGRLKEYSASSGVPAVEFLPHALDKAREVLFSRAAVFVLPTYSENFGNVIGEALIRGVPVITTTGTPWSEIVSRRCGWYVEPNVGELKKAIMEATGADADTLQRMGARGREYAREAFSLSAVRGALLRMYQSVLR